MHTITDLDGRLRCTLCPPGQDGEQKLAFKDWQEGQRAVRRYSTDAAPLRAVYVPQCGFLHLEDAPVAEHTFRDDRGRVRCGLCDSRVGEPKLVYFSEAEAVSAAENAATRDVHLEAYFADECGFWHLASAPSYTAVGWEARLNGLSVPRGFGISQASAPESRQGTLTADGSPTRGSSATVPARGLPPQRRGRRVITWIIIGVVIYAGATAIYNHMEPDPLAAPSPAAQPLAGASPQPVATSTLASAAAAAPPLPVSPRIDTEIPELRVVAHTDGDGVAWRDDCREDARVTTAGSAWAAGTAWGEGSAVLTMVGDDEARCGDGSAWSHVVSAHGDTSWVQREYLSATTLGTRAYAQALAEVGCLTGDVSLHPHPDGMARIEFRCEFVDGPRSTSDLADAVARFTACPVEHIGITSGSGAVVLCVTSAPHSAPRVPVD